MVRAGLQVAIVIMIDHLPPRVSQVSISVANVDECSISDKASWRLATSFNL